MRHYSPNAFRIPNLHRVRRRQTDGRVKVHYYYRPSGQPLPAPSSPDFETAYAEAELAFKHCKSKGLARAETSLETAVAQADTRRATKNAARLSSSQDQLHHAFETSVFLTPEEVCKRWRETIITKTLVNWRAKKIGPPFTKIGKAILYPLEMLEAWERRNLVHFD